MSQPLPVYLITGLLGSGKTSLLLELIKQKPANENWAILINEFGEIDIDSVMLKTASLSQIKSGISVQTIAGGCICCSANISLGKAINELLQSHQFDKLFIEPTGLGHPAKIIDLISKSAFVKPISLYKTLCVITPNQLTEVRWQKSQVMRDLVTLADTIILNKIDLSTQKEQQQAQEILEKC